jgi:hypothetical protein
MHDFLWDAAVRIYEDPAVLGLPAVPDDAYGYVEVNNRKPELIKAMRGILKKVDGFYELLLQLGCAGETMGGALRVPKAVLTLQVKQTAWLESFGLRAEDAGDAVLLQSDGFDGIFPAWRALSAAARACGQPVAAFARGMFDPALPYGDDVFGFLSGSEPLFRSLMEWLRANGYDRKDAVSECGSRIDWRKPFPGKDIGGISIWYDYRKKYPVIFELRIPRFREVLHRYDAMDPRLQALIIERSKKCDGCGYCVQTDRANRKRMTMQAELDGTQHAICPFFLYLCWHGLSEGPIAAMEGLLQFSEWALTAV